VIQWAVTLAAAQRCVASAATCHFLAMFVVERTKPEFPGQCVIEIPLDLGVRGSDAGLLSPDSFSEQA
jgi:hypothetical protein